MLEQTVEVLNIPTVLRQFPIELRTNLIGKAFGIKL